MYNDGSMEEDTMTDGMTTEEEEDMESDEMQECFQTDVQIGDLVLGIARAETNGMYMSAENPARDKNPVFTVATWFKKEWISIEPIT